MRRAAFVLVFLLFATTIAARPLELPRPNEKWITLRVDEFTFISNISPGATTEIARDLLQMRDAVGRITQLKVRSPKPTRVLVFASERGFAPYREAILRRKEPNIRGIFLGADAGNFIVMKRDNAEDIDRTVYHELTHYFVRNTVGGLPLWASEGIAEYYSTFRTAGDSVHIGRPVKEHVQWLREQQLIPVSELLATTVDSPIYNESSRQGVFYAESWALFHYLMTDDARRAQLGEFLRLIGQEKPVDEAFTAAFAKTYAELERELRAYVRGRAFAYSSYRLSALEVPVIPKPEPMSRDALLYELGHLLAHGSRESAAEAQRFLDEALSVNPSHSGAHADAGWLHHVAGRRREADASFARAVQLGSDDAQVHFLVGMSALEDFKGVRNGVAPREMVLKARKAFERSAELDPTSTWAWLGIGGTYVVSDDDPAPGIAALERSLALAPGDVNAAFNLVQLYARAGRQADAERLVATVLTRGASREMLDFAREALLHADVRRMEALGRSGKTEEAAELARSIAVRTTDPDLKAHLENLIAEIDARAKATDVVRAIGDAISKASAGKPEDALAILDEALPHITDPAMLTEAKKLRADLAVQVKKKR